MKTKLIIIIIILIAVVLLIQPQNFVPFQTVKVSAMQKGVNFDDINPTNEEYVYNSHTAWVRVDATYTNLDELELYNPYHLRVLAILDYYTMQEQNFTLAEWNSTVQSYVSSYPFVNAWEIWNEPEYYILGFQNYSPMNYFLMLKSAYTIIKSINPNALVIGFGGVYLQQLSFVQAVINLGGLNYCDAVSLHFYPAIYELPSGGNSWEYMYEYTLNKYKSILDGKPIWVTETGLMSFSTTDYSENIGDQSQYIQEVFPIFEDAGVQVVFWYELQDNTNLINPPISGTWGLLTTQDIPKPSYYTWSNEE